MSVVSVREVDLLGFFEVEPQMLDPDVPWPYNDFTYEIASGDFLLSFAIAPAYRDVRLVLHCKGVVVYELNAVGIEDVRYINDKAVETLEVILNVSDRLTLRLKPSIHLKHESMVPSQNRTLP